MKAFAARSPEASRLRQRKYELVRQFGFPESLLGGTLSATRRRCGKTACRCAQGEGHPQWLVTFSHRGERRVERVPKAWLAELQQVAVDTQAWLDAARELMALNVALLAAGRKQRREQEVRRREKKAPRIAKKRSTNRQPGRSFNYVSHRSS